MPEIVDFDSKIRVGKPTRHYIYGLVAILILAFGLYLLNYFVFSVRVDWRNDYQIFDSSAFTDLSFLGGTTGNMCELFFTLENCSYVISVTDDENNIEKNEDTEIFNGGNLYFMIFSDCKDKNKKTKTDFILKPMKNFNSGYVCDVINNAITEAGTKPDIYYLSKVRYIDSITVNQLRGLELETLAAPLNAWAKEKEDMKLDGNDIYYFLMKNKQKMLFTLSNEAIIIESSDLAGKTKDEMLNLAQIIIKHGD